jgi:hypothetical protein
MSLTGSCFSSESAPRPFHHGIRERGGTIFPAALPSDRRRVQADMQTHLIHRPAMDIIPPLGGPRVSLLSHLIVHDSHAAAISRLQRNSVPSTQMRCRITANRRARTTIAFFIPRRLAICIAQALSHNHFFEHALGCFVEHEPHYLVAAARYSAATIDLARLILGARQSKHRSDLDLRKRAGTSTVAR